MFCWEFPGGPVVRAQAFTTRGLGSVPAQETTGSHAAQPGKKLHSVKEAENHIPHDPIYMKEPEKAEPSMEGSI